MYVMMPLIVGIFCSPELKAHKVSLKDGIELGGQAAQGSR